MVQPEDSATARQEGNNQNSNPRQSPPTPPATFRQKAGIVAWLAASSIALLSFWFEYINILESDLQIETKVAWTPPIPPKLKSGPPTFMFDQSTKALVYKGTIDRQTKGDLLALLEAEDQNTISTYRSAIDELAFKSNKNLPEFLFDLLVLGGLSGLLGVQLRSLINFVGVTCFKRSLDVPTFWPWYFVRPFSGFILGLFVVIVTQAGLFRPGEDVERASALWWVALALLAGFGADEFTQRLRRLTQTVFGDGRSN